MSAFHDDYERLGGDRSEAELRALLEEFDTAVQTALEVQDPDILVCLTSETINTYDR